MNHSVLPDRFGGAPKRATNISLPKALIAEAPALGINLSQACERGLAEAVARRRRERWLADNQAPIAAYNARIERDGLTLAAHRRF